MMIPWWEMMLAIPLSAVVLAMGNECIQTILKHREKHFELRLKMLQEQNKRAGKAGGDVMEQLEVLRAEVAALRDTSTQFDMTTEHAMERMEERLSRLETKAASMPSRTDDVRQTIGQH